MGRYFPPAPESWNERNRSPSHAQLLKLLGLFAATLALVIGGVSLVIDWAVWWIPPQVEQQIGAIARPIYERQAPPSPPQTALNQLLDRLEEHLPPELGGRDFQVLYVPQPTVNALAIPGDCIVIFGGLVKEAASENELMMVLGHELGHFAHRDHLRGIVRSLVLPLAIASVLGDTSGLAQVGTIVSGAKFSQGQELKADEVGLDLLQATYGHGGGAKDFFERQRSKGSVNLDFLSTHPVPQRRLDRIDQRMRQRGYAQGPKTPLPPSLQLP